MTVTPSQAMANGLLARLDPDVLAGLLPKMTPIGFESRQSIYAENGPIEFVFFPLSGMVSMVTNLADGMQAEVGLVGREGMVGTSLVSGVTTSFTESMVQMPGTLLRLAARDFRGEFDDNPAFRTLVLRYSEARRAQVMQTAACNGRHELEQRLARWLLMCHDRRSGETLPLTQELIAMMLGVHRPSVSVAASLLSRGGMIRYSSGRITVTDRDKLEAASCECYGTVHRRVAMLLPPVPGC